MTYIKNFIGTVKSTLYENFIFIYSLLFITIIPEIIMKINYIGYYQKIGKKIEFISHSLLCLIFFLGVFTLFTLLCSRIKLNWIRSVLYQIY